MSTLACENEMANSKFVRMAITKLKQPRHIHWKSYVWHFPRQGCKLSYSGKPRAISSSSACTLALHQLHFYCQREAETLQAGILRLCRGSRSPRRIHRRQPPPFSTIPEVSVSPRAPHSLLTQHG